MIRPDGYTEQNACIICKYCDDWALDDRDLTCVVHGDYTNDREWPTFRQLSMEEQEWIVQVYVRRDFVQCNDPYLTIDNVRYHYDSCQNVRKHAYLKERQVQPNGVCRLWEKSR